MVGSGSYQPVGSTASLFMRSVKSFVLLLNFMSSAILAPGLTHESINYYFSDIFQLLGGAKRFQKASKIHNVSCTTFPIRPSGIKIRLFICSSSLLLVLFSVPRGFSPGIPVFPSPPTFPNSNSIWNCQAL